MDIVRHGYCDQILCGRACPVQAPGRLCTVIHVLISALCKLFVCVFT